MNIKKIIAILMCSALMVGCQSTDSNEGTGTSTDGDQDQGQTEAVEVDMTKYPEKTIEFIVPAAGGAIIDIPTRTVVDIINQDLAEPAVIVNMAGASQTTGTLEALNRAADGYTFLTGAPAGMLAQPHIIENLGYSLSDFRHLTFLSDGIPSIISTSTESEYQTWDDLEAALQSGETLTWSSPNAGGTGQLAMMEVLNVKGYQAEYVPFNGSSEGMAALLGNHIDFYVTDINEIVSKVNDGQLTPILVLDEGKASQFPELTTAGEIGVPGMENLKVYWWVAVHKDTPDEVVAYMKGLLDAAVASDEYKAFTDNISLSPVGTYTEEEVTAIVNAASEAHKESIKKLS